MSVWGQDEVDSAALNVQLRRHVTVIRGLLFYIERQALRKERSGVVCLEQFLPIFHNPSRVISLAVFRVDSI